MKSDCRKRRSALDKFAGVTPPEQPSVSVIIPVFNEISHVAQVAADLLEQDYPNIASFWFVDGGSNDGTVEALSRLSAQDPRVRLIHNPRRSPAAAVNLALEKISSDVVVRFDAHARYDKSVISEYIRTLLSTDAGGVGAIARPAPAESIMGRAIVAAHRSLIGVGIARFRQDGQEGWVDSVWNGCYWKHVMDEVGALREDLWRAEDNDFNARVRSHGYGLYLTPRAKATYQPRQTLHELWRQYFANGTGVVLASASNPHAVSLRHMLPMAFVASLAVTGLAGLAWRQALYVTAGILVVYLAAIIGAAVVERKSHRGLHVLVMPLVLAVLHFSYGLGSLYGVYLLLKSVLLRRRGTKTDAA